MSLVSVSEVPAAISNAIKKASAATGTDFGYLLTTAGRESNFKVNARAETSSAAGLFQFIENTWLGTMKEEGDEFGLEKYTPHIFKTRRGRYYVPNPKVREEILKLRHNPEVSAMMAGAFTRQNAEYMGERLGREPTPGELYIAHFLGPGGAAKLINMAENNPRAHAAGHFPKAAGANHGIFYSRGRPRTIAQVYDMLVRDHGNQQAIVVAEAAKAKANEPAAKTAASAADAGKPQEEVTPAALIVQAQASKDDIAAAARKAVVKPLVPVNARPEPLLKTKQLAALDFRIAETGEKTMNDAGHGSIGPWRTIVHPETQVKTVQQAGLDSRATESGEKAVNDAGPGGLGIWQMIVSSETPAKTEGDRADAPARSKKTEESRGFETHRSTGIRPTEHSATRTLSAPPRRAMADYWIRMSLENG